jgi:hypothetical protein
MKQTQKKEKSVIDKGNIKKGHTKMYQLKNNTVACVNGTYFKNIWYIFGTKSEDKIGAIVCEVE